MSRLRLILIVALSAYFQACGDSVTVHPPAVANLPDAPVLSAIGPKSVDENTTLSFTIKASDQDLDPLVYSAQNLPPGATLDPATGLFSWTPGYGDTGLHAVTFAVSDGSLKDSETVDIVVVNVNRAPVLNPVGPKTVDYAGNLTFTISGSDADGDALVFSALALPPGATINASTGEFRWTPGYLALERYSVTFAVSDGTLSASETVDIAHPLAYPSGPDQYEGDDTIQTAGILNIGEPQLRSIFPVGDKDWVKVNLEGGVKYEFTASHLSTNGDTWIYLHGEDGESVLADNDDCVGYDSCFQYTPEASGLYYLSSNAYTIRGVTSYTLEAHIFQDNDGDGWSNFHDCDESDPTINPKAVEIAGDGIDQNCNGIDGVDPSTPDAFENDGSPATATKLVMAKGMQYEFTRRNEFFPYAEHTIHEVGDEDFFTVEVPPHEIVKVEAKHVFNWPFEGDAADLIKLELVDSGLRVWSYSDGVVYAANDTGEAKTAMMKVTGMATTLPPGGYMIWAVPQGFDNDMDGYGTMGMWSEYDCNDADASIHDEILDIPGDGIDQDCDGADAPPVEEEAQ